MLNGVGGRTVEEAKQRMTYAEYCDWVAYIRKRGTLHQGMRIESAAALVSMMLSRVNGGKAEMADFMPHAKPESGESLSDVMNLLTGGKRG